MIHAILTNIFYLIGIRFLILEVMVFFNPGLHIVEIASIKTLSAELKTEREGMSKHAKDEATKKILKAFWKIMRWQLYYAIWAFIGLFTCQLWLFVTLWSIGIIKNKADKWFGKDNIHTLTLIQQLDAIVCSILLIVIIGHHFF